MRRVVRGFWPLLLVAASGMVLIAGTFWAGAQPPGGGLSKEQEKQIYEALRDVTNQGAKLFNDQGDFAGCFRLYEGTVQGVKPFLGGYPDLQKAIDAGLAEAKATPSVVQKAFALRKVIDQVRDKFKPGGAVQPPPPTDNTFSIAAGGVVKIKQGEKKDVLVTVTRGKDFKGEIKIDLPKNSPGLTASAVADVKETDSSVKVSIKVDKDAPLGKAEVALTGAGGGKTATATIKLEIEKAGVKPPEDPTTFKIGAPGAVKIKAGEKKEVTIAIQRGKEFKDKVEVEFKAGKGVTVTPPKGEVGETDKNLKITIAVDKDAAPGKVDINVSGSGGGKTAKKKIVVDIEKAGDTPPPPDEDKTFKFSPAAVKLKAGEKKEVTITVARGKDLKGKIKLDPKITQGLIINPQKPLLDETDNAFKVTIEAAKTAGPGKLKAVVIGSVGNNAVEAAIEVEIVKGDDTPTPPDGKDKDFKLTGPAAVKLKQGESKDVEIKVARGKDIEKGKITVELKPGKGLNAKPLKTELDAATAGFVATLGADKDAAPGKSEIEITAIGGGKTHKVTIAVEIEKAGAAPPPVDKDKLFKITVGPTVKLKAGEQQKVAVALMRDKGFFDPVTVELKAGKGLKVTPQKDMMVASLSLPVTISADKDVAPGEVVIEVTATAGGKIQKATITVEIEKAVGNPPPDKKSTVSGKVTLDGKPVPIGQVIFKPSDAPTMPTYFAPLKSDGTYEITAASFFAPGKYAVTYKAPAKVLPDQPNVIVPAKYLDAKTSGITAEIKEGQQTFNIDLKSDKKPDNPPPPPGKTTLSGKVTLDGKPLPGGSVGFVPTDLSAAVKLHLSLIKADGTYAFADGELPPGTYKVGVGGPDKLPPGAAKIEIPKQYQAAINSPLTYTVKTGAHSFDIVLQSDKKTEVKSPDKK